MDFCAVQVLFISIPTTKYRVVDSSPFFGLEKGEARYMLGGAYAHVLGGVTVCNVYAFSLWIHVAVRPRRSLW